MREQVYADLDRAFDEALVVSDRVMVRLSSGPGVRESQQAFTEGRHPRFDALPAGFDPRTVLEP
jgi:hypothetical protein